jgi:hypothetical protein
VAHMAALRAAISNGYLKSVKRLVAGGADMKET